MNELTTEAIKSKFSYVAHVETIETNVLLLRVRAPVGSALQPTKGGEPSYPTRSPQNKISTAPVRKLIFVTEICKPFIYRHIKIYPQRGFDSLLSAHGFNEGEDPLY